MKLKYKKMILIISMSAMGIGMVTLSLSKPRDKKEGKEPAVAALADAGTDEEDIAADETKIVELVGKPGDGELRMDVYPAINELVKKYMSAKVACDYETLRTLVNDSSVIDEDDLRAKSEYVEDYRNIVCYTLNGLTEDSFIVYVYEDLKILNVNTLAPGMTRLYIKLDESGNPYIYLGAIDDETQKFIQETSTHQAVIDIINTVNTKLDEAVTKDEDLKNFVEDRSNSSATQDKKVDDSKSKDSESTDKESTKKETTKKESTKKDSESSDKKDSSKKEASDNN
ncbi:hypothetical protein SAMN02746066_02215 [Anaerosporobacter mobilis DSM 15930]|jgi:hypothetical protein|uniref:Uncharacterized protein n=1 Tax=Anaerosporobacter mobilis DSM 15930 TaxID=1120996 RepID=A0A1M7JE27_9FIRM|nr:hypothetical protein [Anaerosporobacter mobilis]SHM51228.1 hypothetical protein SAMN02746066_02215 [Anaerosporobacter mobilis DSM 15930]